MVGTHLAGWDKNIEKFDIFVSNTSKWKGAPLQAPRLDQFAAAANLGPSHARERAQQPQRNWRRPVTALPLGSISSSQFIISSVTQSRRVGSRSIWQSL